MTFVIYFPPKSKMAHTSFSISIKQMFMFNRCFQLTRWVGEEIYYLAHRYINGSYKQKKYIKSQMLIFKVLPLGDLVQHNLTSSMFNVIQNIILNFWLQVSLSFQFSLRVSCYLNTLSLRSFKFLSTTTSLSLQISSSFVRKLSSIHYHPGN